jgi:hypothetical protein
MVCYDHKQLFPCKVLLSAGICDFGKCFEREYLAKESLYYRIPRKPTVVRRAVVGPCIGSSWYLRLSTWTAGTTRNVNTRHRCSQRDIEYGTETVNNAYG